MLGAIREDDVTFDDGEIENSPQDEPFGTFVRVLHHFYDPYRDWPLKAAGIDLGVKAPDWAIRGVNAIDGHDNSFSLTMAREAMWRALTLKLAPGSASPNGPLSDLAFIPSANIGSREALRVAYWATTFRALGDAVHLLQDMAQPQHTRNDFHGGQKCVAGACLAGHKSYYEAYVEARVTGATGFRLRNRSPWNLYVAKDDEAVRASEVAFSGYPIVRNGSFDHYFSTANGGGSTLGTGLANFTNQGFYSAGTVVDSLAAAAYGSPPALRAGLTEYRLPSGEVVNAAGLRVDGGGLILWRGPVSDALNPAESRSAIALAAEGAFDQFLRPTSLRHTTLNHYNYAAQAELLLPRAVAYSAGLLDYFFRGMLEIGLPDEGVYAARDVSPASCTSECGFTGVKLKLTNATPEESMGPGVAVAVVKFHRNKCHRSDLSGEPGGPNFVGSSCRNPEEEIVVSAGRAIASQATGTTQTILFDFQDKPIPLNATDVSLQVVFRGKLGNEDDALAVTTRNIAEPTYLALENATDFRYNVTTNSYAPSGAPVAFTDAKVRFGAATKSLATLASLPAPGHAQLAFLGDAANTPVVVDFAAASLVGGHPLTATLPAFQFYLPPGSGTTYAANWPVSPVRGVYRRFVYSVALTSGYEVYLCTQDFNPLACGESTLPPLTAANAVAWTVDLR